MHLLAGTSGFSYKEWIGSFYPADVDPKGLLAAYAERLPAVEINNTFYRLPRVSVLESWAEQVPDHFRFAIKASRKITHFGRLAGVEDETRYLIETVSTLGPACGPVLFQLPPNLKRDPALLEAFCDLLPVRGRIAFEFRHPSWLEDEGCLELLDARGYALCVADTDEVPGPALRPAPGWGYLRLRRSGYDDEGLSAWLERIREAGWEEAYVFFKHEDEAAGPRMAERLLELAG